MSDDNKFWLAVCMMVVTAFTVIVVTLINQETTKSALVAEAIKNGTDPLAAHCALKSPVVTMCARLDQKKY